MYMTGRVISAATGEPVENATVELWAGSVMLTRVAADSDGAFQIASSGVPTKIVIDSASYAREEWELPGYGDLRVYELTPEIKEQEPVIVTATPNKKGMGLLLLLFATLLVVSSKKR